MLNTCVTPGCYTRPCGNAAKRRRGAGWAGGVRHGEEALDECEGEAEHFVEEGAKEWVRHGEEALVE
jgi:hypothetical protein